MKTGLVLWVAGSVGLVLIVSAYRNVSPLDVVRARVTGTPQPTAPVKNANPALPITDVISNVLQPLLAPFLPSPYKQTPKTYLTPRGPISRRNGESG